MTKALKSATKVVNSAEQKAEEKVTPTEQDSVVAVATDNVPEGEPTENEDGSVNENNEKVETMSADEVKKAEESVSDIQIDPVTPTEQANNEHAPKVNVEVAPTGVDEKRKPEERVKIRLRVDHNCCIAMEFYEFKANKVYTVPKNVKRILNRAGLLAPL